MVAFSNASLQPKSQAYHVFLSRNSSQHHRADCTLQDDPVDMDWTSWLGLKLWMLYLSLCLGVWSPTFPFLLSLDYHLSFLSLSLLTHAVSWEKVEEHHCTPELEALLNASLVSRIMMGSKNSIPLLVGNTNLPENCYVIAEFLLTPISSFSRL